jgi:hypothetical protein
VVLEAGKNAMRLTGEGHEKMIQGLVLRRLGGLSIFPGDNAITMLLATRHE